jgi:non-specific serine/threonine protein kinase
MAADHQSTERERVGATRREEVERLFERAAELDPAFRAEFLNQACAGDADLRREVERLLALDEEARDFLEQPALDLEARADARQATEVTLLPGMEVGPYRVIAKLGSGGMGEVYQAHDTRLKRDVALKFLPRQFSEDAQSVERFRREARAASALNHPNICSVYDIGEWDHQPFLVMELLEGQTLRQRLAQGPLPAVELESVARQAASALHAAHAKGIVHRDIKPANLLVSSDGTVKILDFGLAKLVSEAPQPAAGAAATEPAELEDSITVSGTVIGTLPYMSPEQIRGERVDARSDLFSLGATLYQAAAGAPPFQGANQREITAAILGQAPVPPCKLQPHLPPEWGRIILKALERDPRLRYQTALELQDDLARLAGKRSGRRTWIWVAAAALVAVGAIAPAIRSWRAASGPQIRSMAVLPLRNLSDAAQEHVADGISEAIAGDLMKLPGLRVVSPASAMQYRDTAKKASEIGRELRVDAVIRGSARYSGDRMQVQVQLIRASTDAPVWAESFDVDLIGIERLKSDVARGVAREIRMRLLPSDEARLAKTGTRNREAFEAYLRGRHYWGKRTDADIQRAVGCFREAIDADPAFAAAYAALADSYNQFATVRIGRSPVENRALAVAAARRAIEIDEESAEAHAALGFANLYNWNWEAAEVELRRALELNPSYASARVWHATNLAIRRRFDEAIREVEQARDLDPLSVITQTQVGWIYKFAGRNEEAIREYRKALSADPNFGWALWQLGESYINLGRFQEAIDVLEKCTLVSKDNPSTLGALGEAYALGGRKADARRLLAQLARMSSERYVTPVAAVYICLGLDDRNCLFQNLEKAYQERANFIAFLSVLPSPLRYGAVRADPRFQNLLRRLGYERE